jgi:hypothetical protein
MLKIGLGTRAYFRPTHQAICGRFSLVHLTFFFLLVYIYIGFYFILLFNIIFLLSFIIKY